MSYARNLLSRGEEVVYESRQHWFAVIARTWFWILLAIVALAVVIFLASGEDPALVHNRYPVLWVALNDDGSAAARRFHERVRNQDLFSVRLCTSGTEQVDVELPELALATTLWAFIAHVVRDTEPTSRIASLLLACGDHTGNCRCHLGTNSDGSTTAVGKGIGLFVDDLLASLGSVELERLEQWCAVFFVAKALSDFAPG